MYFFSAGKLRRRQFYSQPLENGRVLSQGSTFTYQDVVDQLLVYTPDVVSGGTDELGFTLTDGIHTHTGRLEFTMDVRRSEGPRMTVNRGLQLAAGGFEGGGSRVQLCFVLYSRAIHLEGKTQNRIESTQVVELEPVLLHLHVDLKSRFEESSSQK